MADMEPFTLIEERSRPGPHHLFDDVLHYTNAQTADHDLQYVTALREAFPDMIVTGVPSYNINLRVFAAAGFASYELDSSTDSFWSWRGYVGPSKQARNGSLAESVHFAKYHYKFGTEDFILYTVGAMQYILKERREGEPKLGPSRMTDALINSIGHWMLNDVVWVFDGYWYADKNMYHEIRKMNWSKVILDEAMKKDLVDVAGKFFESKDIYEDLGVPWKRGLLFHGPPGNGKTISIKALMHTLLDRKPSIPTLYVKSAPNPYAINNVFTQARALAPCMLVLEDVETIVTPYTRSYFFNQMDGLENNDGLFIVASTNFLDRLDPGLTKRPSRFDRKYLFPLPNEHERVLYCQFWRTKLAGKQDIEFPVELLVPMARITPGFSFAFLQECFVATLLVMAHERDDVTGRSNELDKYKLWVKFKETAEMLRKQIEDGEQLVGSSSSLPASHSPPPPMGQASVVNEQRLAGLPNRRIDALPCFQAPDFGAGGMLGSFGRMAVKDEVILPGLPRQKQTYINPAAYMQE